MFINWRPVAQIRPADSFNPARAWIKYRLVTTIKATTETQITISNPHCYDYICVLLDKFFFSMYSNVVQGQTNLAGDFYSWVSIILQYSSLSVLTKMACVKSHILGKIKPKNMRQISRPFEPVVFLTLTVIKEDICLWFLT